MAELILMRHAELGADAELPDDPAWRARGWEPVVPEPETSPAKPSRRKNTESPEGD